eukprot:6192406-Pleurochrysis_carterae.AAC.1
MHVPESAYIRARAFACVRVGKLVLSSVQSVQSVYPDARTRATLRVRLCVCFRSSSIRVPSIRVLSARVRVLPQFKHSRAEHACAECACACAPAVQAFACRACVC